MRSGLASLGRYRLLEEGAERADETRGRRDQRSQWRGNTAAAQDTVRQLGKHNPLRPAIPESGTRSIAVSTERRLASRSVASADRTARGHRRDMADDPTGQ
jgi:hypothetical protein